MRELALVSCWFCSLLGALWALGAGLGPLAVVLTALAGLSLYAASDDRKPRPARRRRS